MVSSGAAPRTVPPLIPTLPQWIPFRHVSGYAVGEQGPAQALRAAVDRRAPAAAGASGAPVAKRDDPRPEASVRGSS